MRTRTPEKFPDTALQRALAALGACAGGRRRVGALRIDRVWARHESVNDLVWLVAKVAATIHPGELQNDSLWTRILHTAYCTRYDERTSEQAMILDMLYDMKITTVRDITRPIIQIWARRRRLPARMKGWR